MMNNWSLTFKYLTILEYVTYSRIVRHLINGTIKVVMDPQNPNTHHSPIKVVLLRFINIKNISCDSIAFFP